MGIEHAIKRVFDVAACLMVLALGAPVFIIIALIVRLSSPGPVLFIQERTGRHGRAFRMYKFRTMVGRKDESILVWTTTDEQRITRVGRFLRDYGLDELPQVINILKGDMSIVGPRPPRPLQAERYSDHQRHMFSMRPGVISLADVKGRRSIPTEERIEWHVWYVENWSIRLDLEILWKTLLIVLRRENAEETDFGDGNTPTTTNGCADATDPQVMQ